MGEYIDKRMSLMKFPQGPASTFGNAGTFAFVFEVISTFLGKVAEVPSHRDIGLPRNIDVGPGLEVPHIGLDEKASVENGLEVTEADLAVSEGADTDSTPPQLVPEIRRPDSVRRRDDAVFAGEGL